MQVQTYGVYNNIHTNDVWPLLKIIKSNQFVLHPQFKQKIWFTTHFKYFTIKYKQTVYTIIVWAQLVLVYTCFTTN